MTKRTNSSASKKVKTRVTVPTHDAGRDMEVALDALRAIAGWASDEGPLTGKGPMDVSAFAAATLKKLEA